jgi:anti-sigma28 factor (negative regulator of flagellin synthesis)
MKEQQLIGSCGKGQPAAHAAVITEARENRVAELRQAYAGGTYKVDVSKLSAKIVDKHLRP